MEDTKKVSKILVIKNSRVLLLFSKRLKKYHLPGGHVQEDENFLKQLKENCSRKQEYDYFGILF